MQSGFTFLCCLAIEMWVMCKSSPSIAAHTRQEDASQRTLSLSNPQGRNRQPSARAPQQPWRIFNFFSRMWSHRGQLLRCCCWLGGQISSSFHVWLGANQHLLCLHPSPRCSPACPPSHCLHAMFPDSWPKHCGMLMLTKLPCGLTREKCQGLIQMSEY